MKYQIVYDSAGSIIQTTLSFNNHMLSGHKALGYGKFSASTNDLQNIILLVH